MTDDHPAPRLSPPFREGGRGGTSAPLAPWLFPALIATLLIGGAAAGGAAPQIEEPRSPPVTRAGTEPSARPGRLPITLTGATVTPSPTATTIPSAPFGDGSELVRAAPGRKQVALTFDTSIDFATPVAAQLREVLRRHGVRCTFFVGGWAIRADPGGVQAIAADGHELANHSDTHPDFTTISNAAIARELDALETQIVQLTGKSTKPLFRAPSGARDARVLNAARQAGYRHVYWSKLAPDWLLATSTAQIIAQVANAQDGDVIVLHTSSPQTVAALPTIIDSVRGRGLSFVTVGEMLRG